MRRPTNHVTQRHAANLSVIYELPRIPMAAIRELETKFPPRCKGVNESEGDHQRYAGAVALIARLKACALPDDRPEDGRTQTFEDWARDDLEDEEQAMTEAAVATAEAQQHEPDFEIDEEA